MCEACVHHGGGVFMRGLRSDRRLLRPLTRERPAWYWLLSDASEAAPSDGQFVFHHSDPVLAYLGERETVFPLLLARKAGIDVLLWTKGGGLLQLC